MSFDLENYKIDVNELEPLTNAGNIISMVHNGNKDSLNSAISQMQNHYLDGCIQEEAASYMDSLKQSV